MNKYTERLYLEWTKHGKIIVASDFDDTISPWGHKSEEDLKQMDDIISLLKKAKETGAYIVIWSACTKDRFPEITEYCKSKGLEIDAINQNPIDLPYGKDKKIYANIYLDDRAGLSEALKILSDAMYLMRSHQQLQRQPTDVA